MLNVNLRPDGPLSLERVAALGVRRVTFGSSLFRDAMAGIRRMAEEIQVAAGAAGAVLAPSDAR